MPPIHLSSTFKQKSPGDFKYEYARTNNPTREILEKTPNFTKHQIKSCFDYNHDNLVITAFSIF